VRRQLRLRESGPLSDDQTSFLGPSSRNSLGRRDATVSLDSSFLIDLLAGVPRAVAKARELDGSGEPRYVTAPAASEVLFGGYRLGGAYLERTRFLVEGLSLLQFDQAACHTAGRLGAELASRGTPLGQGDLFIAAISLRHHQRLLTRDRSFGLVPGLAIEGY
jgi:predicted nucleic acid-binding protein